MGDLNINFKKFGSEFDNSRFYNIVCLSYTSNNKGTRKIKNTDR